MIRIERHVGRLLWVATVLAITGAASVARAQDEELDENEKADVNIKAQRQLQLDPLRFERQLENWIFGQFGGAAAARDKLETTLALRVDAIARACGITVAQKKKLRVAGQGDLKRFFDRVEEAKQKVRKLEGPWNINNVNLVRREAATLQKDLAAPWFEDGSLFGKAVRHTLTQEQIVRFDQALRDRKVLRYRAAASLVVVVLARSMGWSDEQRRRFERLLLNETRPPKSFGPSDYYVVMYQASKLPENVIKPIFDDLQWRLLSRRFAQAKRMEQWLMAGGYVPDDQPANARPAAVASVRPAEPKPTRANP
jgi:hypothetical protein